MSHVSNPFLSESNSDQSGFTDREALLPGLITLLQDKGARIFIFGRRRMGKTSLIKRASAKAKIPFAYVDIAKAASLTEVARKLMEAVPEDLRTGGGDHTTLEGVLTRMNAFAVEKNEVWTICLDEFHEIRGLGDPRIDAQLRLMIQEHRNLNYVFTGPDFRIVGWITDPLSKHVHQIDVGGIEPDHMAHWIEGQATGSGISPFPYGDEIVRTAGPCTGDIIRLAACVFSLAMGEESPVGLVARAFDGIALLELNTEFLNQWRNLPASQRMVLRAVADGKKPTASDTMRESGMKAASTAGTAVAALIDRQFLVRTEHGVVVENPFFARWVAFHGSGT